MSVCWFTDPDRVAAQSLASAFGPVPGQEATHFRITSRHLAADDASRPPAYAVVDGKVFAVAAGPVHCTIILVPDRQPFGTGAGIAAFVYRNVRRNTIVTDSNTIVDRNTSDLAADIWRRYDETVAINTAADPPVPAPPDPTGAELGLVDALDPMLAVEELARGAAPGVSGAHVESGDHLGDFDPAGFGFEVSTPRHWNAPIMEALTIDDPLIEGADLGVDPDPGEVFVDRQHREAALDSMDPAAFFGAMVLEGLAVRRNGAAPVTVEPAGAVSDILSLYSRPDRVWIDVRDHANASYNHDLLEAEPALRLTIRGGTPQIADPYTAGWPIVTLSATDMTSATITGAAAEPAVEIAVAFPNPDRFDHAARLAHAITVDSWPRLVQGDDAFVDRLPESGDTGWTESVQVVVPAVPHATPPVPIASLVRIQRCRRFDFQPGEAVSDLAQLRPISHLDGLFPLVDIPARAPDVGKLGVLVRFRTQQTWIDDPAWSLEAQAVVTGMGIDGEKVCFLGYPVDRATQELPHTPSIGLVSADAPDSDNVLHVIAGEIGGVEPGTIPVEEAARITELKALVPTIPTRRPSMSRPDPDDLMGLTVSRQEYDGILASANAENIHARLPRILGLRRVDEMTGLPGWFSPADTWEIVVRGYEYTGTTVARREVPTEVFVEIPSRATGPDLPALGTSRPLTQPGVWPITERRRLHSALFVGNPDLTLVAMGFQTLSAGDPNLRGKFIEKIQAAVKIVLPQMDGADATDRSIFTWTPDSDVFDDDLAIWIRRFQNRAAAMLAGANFPDGVVDRQTLLLLDGYLEQITYYVSEPVAQAHAIHNESKARPIGLLTLVSADSADIYEEPAPGKPVIETLGFNDRVLILSILASRWCLVTAEGPRADGANAADILPSHGYMRLSDLHTSSPMPDPFARLHRIQPGETVLGIVGQYFGAAGALIPGVQVTDQRYYANVLLAVNNPRGEPMMPSRSLNTDTGLFEEGPPVPASIWTEFQVEDLGSAMWELLEVGIDSASDTVISPLWGLLSTLASERTWEALAGILELDEFWRNAHLLAPDEPGGTSLLWIPSREMADSLYVQVDSGSLTTGLSIEFAELGAKLAGDLLGDDVLGAFELTWPVGTGFTVRGTVGATFGIPVSVDADGEFYIWRDSENEIKVIKWGEVMPALDVGVGAGVFFGLGKLPRKRSTSAGDASSAAMPPLDGESNPDENWGIGAVIGAEAIVGLRGFALEELTIPISDIPAIAAVIKRSVHPRTQGRGDADPPDRRPHARVIAHRIMSIFQAVSLREDEFRTALKVKADLKADANAAASVGLRFGPQEHERQAWKSWDNDEPSLNFGKGVGIITNFLGNRLSGTLGVSANAEISGGVEFRMSDFQIDNASGRRIPMKAEATLALDGEVGISIAAPMISQLLAVIPLPGALGGGIKFTLHYDFNGTNDAFEPGNEVLLGARELSMALYTKSGELDFYDGAAHESILALDPTHFFTIERSAGRITGVQLNTTNPLSPDMLKDVDVTLRLGGVSFGGLTSRFADRMKNRRRLPVLLKSTGKAMGTIREGYLDLQYRMPGALVKDLAVAVFDDVVRNNARGISAFGDWLFTALETGAPPEQRPELLQRLIEAIDLYDADLHFQIGYGFAGGAKLKAGGGIRLRLATSGALIFHYDVMEEVKALAGETVTMSFRKLSETGHAAWKAIFTEATP